MTVILVLAFLVAFLTIDAVKTHYENRVRVPRGTMITSPDFEMLGALAQDGGERLKEEAETEEIMKKFKRTRAVGVTK